MKFENNKNLQPYNTFGIEAFAKQFVAVNSNNELLEVLKNCKNTPYFILGGGSNILLTKDISRLVIQINTKGIECLEKNDTHVFVKVAAGENWHNFVLHCVSKNWGGIENMALIPGNVGTAPIQNIGAYGVELKDVFESCTVLDTHTLEWKTLNAQDCAFGYRNSIFKSEQKGKYIITDVTFRLTQKNNHILKTSYGAIKDELLLQNASTPPTIAEIANAVIAIRTKKLPDPKQIGNSGSFFKNPVITKEEFSEFILRYPDAPYYKNEENYKIPAGWLIEKLGYKGKTINNYGVHKMQALVLVNYGGANGKDILDLSKEIQQKVFETFKITLEAEVNIL